MTLEEARKIARVVGMADGGCSVCVGNLVEHLQKQFPEFTWKMGESKTAHFKYDGTAATEDDDDFSEHFVEIEVT